jgi:hypothetical protein
MKKYLLLIMISISLFGCFNPEEKRLETISRTEVVEDSIDEKVMEYHYVKVIDRIYTVRTKIVKNNSNGDMFRLDSKGGIKSNMTSTGMGIGF